MWIRLRTRPVLAVSLGVTYCIARWPEAKRDVETTRRFLACCCISSALIGPHALRRSQRRFPKTERISDAAAFAITCGVADHYGQGDRASFLSGHRAHDPAFAWTLTAPSTPAPPAPLSGVSIAPALCCRATVAARVRVTPDRTPLRQINARADARGHRQPVSGGTPCVSPSSLPHWRRSGPAC